MKINASAIIVAGGTGARFGGDIPKQFLEIGGKSLLEHSIANLFQVESIKELIVVLPADQIDLWEKLDLSPYDTLKSPVNGGAQRQESVWNGMQQVSSEQDIILVHDAVRPFAKRNLIEQAIQSAYFNGGAILAERSRNTLKLSRDGKNIETTIDREQIWNAQTPQVFQRELLFKAYEKIMNENKVVTDEAQAVEFLGHSVELIESPVTNLKITFAEDILFAENLIQKRLIET